MDYTYYNVTMFENKNDTLANLPYKGGVKGIKWLKFKGDDNNLEFDKEVENESLAMKILLQNLQMIEHTFIASNDPSTNRKFGDKWLEIKNEKDLKSVIEGRYEKVVVSKYMSNRYIR